MSNILSIPVSELRHRVQQFSSDNYRLVQICCTTKETFALLYSFDRGLEMTHLRIELPIENATVPSISGTYGSAVLYENEIHDLFGISFPGLTLDYKGNFYQLATPTPFAPNKEKTS